MAAQDTAWAVTRFKVWAEIHTADLPDVEDELAALGAVDEEGFVQLDCSSFTSNFGLNEMPQAAVSLVIGREVNSLKPSPAHLVINALHQLIPVKVYVQQNVISSSGPSYDPALPAGPFLAFDGLVTSSSFRTSFGKAEFVIGLIHWLAQLSFSSMLSSLWAPGTPNDYTFKSVLGVAANAPSGNAQADCIVVAGLNLVNFAELAPAKDIWGKAMGVLFQALAANVKFDISPTAERLATGNVKCDIAPGENVDALAALDRMEPFNGGYKYASACPLRSQFNQLDFSAGTAMGIIRSVPSDLGSTSFWDKLVGEWVPSFQLAVVPMIERALVVPFLAGIQQDGGATSWRKVLAQELTSGEYDASMPRPLRGVSMLIRRAQVGGNANTSILKGTQGKAIQETGALYDACRPGAFIYKQAPAWMGNYNMYRAGLNASKILEGTQVTPGQPAVKAADYDIWGAYAQALYVQEVLRYRQARFTGRPRWDIAPGSAIAVEMPVDYFVEQTVGKQVLYGTVTRVSTTISAEGAPPSTTFLLAFVTTEEENDDPAYSYASHPMWDTTGLRPGFPLAEFVDPGGP